MHKSLLTTISLRQPFLIFFGMFAALSSIGQGIEKIILSSKAADEPPTKQWQSEYSIEFSKSEF
jgi:fructose-specific phosphotransferase system IIC component